MQNALTIIYQSMFYQTLVPWDLMGLFGGKKVSGSNDLDRPGSIQLNGVSFPKWFLEPLIWLSALLVSKGHTTYGIFHFIFYAAAHLTTDSIISSPDLSLEI